jgi:peptide subunit release factor RF-3
MLLDCAKGVEAQTRKLFEVCKHAADPDLHLRQQDGSPRHATRSS